MLASKFQIQPKPYVPKCKCPKTTLSPSQIDSYRACQRRWGFRKLAGLPEPQWSFQDAGQTIHGSLEKYAKDGVLPERTARLAIPVWKAVQHLPMPSPAHRCEEHFTFTKDGSEFHGFIDLQPDNEPAVIDYKTVSVREKPFEFALDVPGLMQDSQALVYGYHKVVNEGAGAVYLKWIYLERKSPFRVKVVQVLMEADEIETGFQKLVLPVAKEILRHQKNIVHVQKDLSARVQYVNHLDATTTHCSAYGGCPFTKECTAYKKPSLGEKFMAIDTQARLAAIRAKKATAINPPAEPEDETDADDDGDEEAQLQAQLAAARAAKASKKAALKLAEKSAEKTVKKMQTEEREQKGEGVTLSLHVQSPTFLGAVTALRNYYED